MADINKPPLVKMISGIIAGNEDMLARTRELLAAEYGPIDLTSDIWNFDFTDYYENEMGSGLLRQFISFEKLIIPDIMAHVKIRTNEMEYMLAAEFSNDGVKRPINIDPGYIMPSKLVLASTKNFAHRIYLRDGIFAEITLHWQKGAFIHHEWTFPDYRTERYKAFFTRVRQKLMQEKQGYENRT